MSEIVATLPLGTQVVVEAQLLTSDVDHTIEEVRQEVHHQGGLTCGGGVSRTSSNRTLFCRKCEGHGQQVVLKGHASRCPFNNCQCKTCSNVMSMRANAIIRRYRTRTLEGGLVLKPVHFKNGNTRLRVFPKYVDESDALPIPMNQQQQAQRQHAGISLEQLNLEQAMALQAMTQPQTPPSTAVPTSLNQQQPPFPVKRSFSEELEVHRQSGSPKDGSSIEQSPTTLELPNTSLPMSLSIIEMLLRQQGINPDLLTNGMIPTTSDISTTMPSTLYDNTSLFSGLQFPQTSVHYSSPTTYSTNNFNISTTSIMDTLQVDRKISDAALICPVGAQLSELNIGVTTNSPIHAASIEMSAPKLTPNMFETSCTVSNEVQVEDPTNTKPEPELFSQTFMIAPTADRSHPLFRRFLNTVRELEKQMLVDNDS
ncbi:unnamed protein product [Caenorhabditis angaria]|uniref:DM domain-containing protein n=1 Tax=Caenorhabditis angaria TaxID=860376 RepID=A0A9P1IWZ8_9PELO|nr:unnamed protein product [Caenorhabditis angaria]